jgi:hypothetical protein
MEYRVLTSPEPSSPLFRFDIAEYTGKLTGSGDTMELSAQITFFDVNGNRLNPDGTPGTESVPFNANGVRIPLKMLPDTFQHLPIPPTPVPPM